MLTRNPERTVTGNGPALVLLSCAVGLEPPVFLRLEGAIVILESKIVTGLPGELCLRIFCVNCSTLLSFVFSTSS